MADIGERRIARAGTLTREEIAAAALRLFAQEGLPGLSMRRLGAELGVHYSTLYWHVTDKRELLRLVLDAVLAGVRVPPPIPSGESWRDELAALFSSLRGALSAHPGAAGLLIDLGVPGPNGLAITERALGLLRGSGMTNQQASWVYVALKQYTAVSAQRDAGAEERVRQAADELAEMPATAFPNVMAVGSALFAPDTEESFRFGLRCLLDGIASVGATP